MLIFVDLLYSGKSYKGCVIEHLEGQNSGYIYRVKYEGYGVAPEDVDLSTSIFHFEDDDYFAEDSSDDDNDSCSLSIDSGDASGDASDDNLEYESESESINSGDNKRKRQTEPRAARPRKATPALLPIPRKAGPRKADNKRKANPTSKYNLQLPKFPSLYLIN